MAEPTPKRKEIYTYTAPWLIYGMNWSVRADQRFGLAIALGMKQLEEVCDLHRSESEY